MDMLFGIIISKLRVFDKVECMITYFKLVFYANPFTCPLIKLPYD